MSLQGNSISQFLRALKRNPNVHFEMYIGADDQMTPPEAAQILANYAKTSNRGQVPANLTLEIVPNQGHALDVHIPTAAKVVGSGASHPDAKGK